MAKKDYEITINRQIDEVFDSLINALPAEHLKVHESDKQSHTALIKYKVGLVSAFSMFVDMSSISPDSTLIILHGDGPYVETTRLREGNSYSLNQMKNTIEVLLNRQLGIVNKEAEDIKKKIDKDNKEASYVAAIVAIILLLAIILGASGMI